MERAIYPGSFDPVTLGHLDLIERAARLCRELIVAVIDNPSKQTMFSLAERQQLLSRCLVHLPNVRLETFRGLLVEFVRAQQAQAVVRGLRDAGDVSLELQMARLNRGMEPACETLFLAADSRFVHVSSSFVREIARLGGPIEALVHPQVAESVYAKVKARGNE